MRREFIATVVGAFLLVSGVALAQQSFVDLSISKDWQDFSEGPLSSVIAGETAVIHLSVANLGEVDSASNVVVEDFLPAGVTPLYVSADQGSYLMGEAGNPARPFTWNVGYVVANNEPLDLYLTVQVDPAVADQTTLWNDAAVFDASPLDYDVNNANNLATASVYVTTEADLEVDIAGAVDGGDISGPALDVYDGDLVSGTLVTYAIRVRNFGPSVARDVILSNFVTDGMRIQGAHIIGGDGTATVLNMAAEGDFVVCDLGDIAPFTEKRPNAPPNGALAAGMDAGERVVTVDMLVLPDAYFTQQSVSSSATVRSGDLDFVDLTYDPFLDNNTASLTAGLIGEVDASITKTANVATVLPGGQVVYTITVTNAGPSDGFEVTTVDEMPYGMTLTGVTTNQTEFLNYGEGGLWWGLLVLRKGETATIQLQASVTSDPALVGTTIINEAQVYLEGEGGLPAPAIKGKGFGPKIELYPGYAFDPNVLNNTAIASVLVGTANLPDLVAEWWDCGFGKKGASVYGTLHVTNQGTAMARNFRVFMGMSDDGQSMSILGKSVTIKYLAPGSSVDLPFKYSLGKSGMGQRQIMGFVDPKQTVPETFENNNTSFWGEI